MANDKQVQENIVNSVKRMAIQRKNALKKAEEKFKLAKERISEVHQDLDTQSSNQSTPTKIYFSPF
jgi:hypothetical protein